MAQGMHCCAVNVVIPANLTHNGGWCNGLACQIVLRLQIDWFFIVKREALTIWVLSEMALRVPNLR
jgi:hypothetical protein